MRYIKIVLGLMFSFFFIFGSIIIFKIDPSLILKSKGIGNFPFHFWLPTIFVFIYSLATFVIIYLFKKVNPKIITFSESVYFLGFIFTLISVSSCLLKYDTVSNNFNLIFNFAGIAFTTTIVGLISKILMDFHFTTQNDIDDVRTDLLNKLNENLNRYTDSFNNFLSSRKSDLNDLKEKENLYKNSIIEFSDSINNLKQPLDTVLSLTINQLNNFKQFDNDFPNIVDKINEISESLNSSSSNLSITSNKLISTIDTFNNKVILLDNVLNSFSELLNHSFKNYFSE